MNDAWHAHLVYSGRECQRLPRCFRAVKVATAVSPQVEPRWGSSSTGAIALSSRSGLHSAILLPARLPAQFGRFRAVNFRSNLSSANLDRLTSPSPFHLQIVTELL